MKILIIGQGAREAALAQTIKRQHPEAMLFMAPGNGGAGRDYTNVALAIDDYEGLLAFVKKETIDLTIVGPEKPLVDGIVDRFEAAKLPIFGPNQQCAQFEGSKDFTKAFLTKYNIPTAAYQTFSASQCKEAQEAVEDFSLPVVIKADGLAAGKGVLICNTYEEAKQSIAAIFQGKFQEAGKKIVIEEYLTGVEMSLLCFADGRRLYPMETARDYKRIGVGDEGPNTGGMGGYSPNPIVTPKLKQCIKETILTPIADGLREENLDFKGILFIGLMIDGDQAKVLEFNVRLGDPETQSILPRLKTDLIKVMTCCRLGTLDTIELEWDTSHCFTVVLTSKGYPDTYSKGDSIKGLEDISPEINVYHGGTLYEEGTYQTNGGRVLALTAQAPTKEEARKKVYEAIKKIEFEGMYYRSDL